MAYWGEAMTATHPIWNQDNPGGRPRGAGEARRDARRRARRRPAARAKKPGSARRGAVRRPGSLAERDAAFLARDGKHRARPIRTTTKRSCFSRRRCSASTRGDRNLPTTCARRKSRKRVLARNPQHPGAAHYWIHGMDDPAARRRRAAGRARAGEDRAGCRTRAAHGLAHLHCAGHVGRCRRGERALGRAGRCAGTRREQAGARLRPLPRVAAVRLLPAGPRCAMPASCSTTACATRRWRWRGSRAHPGEQLYMEKTPEALKRYLDIERVAMRGTMIVETAPMKTRAGSRWPTPMAQAARSASMHSRSATRRPRPAISPPRARNCSACARSPARPAPDD